jgi:hypothetical protein
MMCFPILSGYLYVDNPNFGQRQDLGIIEYNPLNEASGIAASRKNPHVLWTHNDSGNQAHIYALNLQGRHLGVYGIPGISIRDWEDIAIGPGPVAGEQYIYIGDIGDNLAQHDLKFIYRIPEPIVDFNQAPVDTSISGVEVITFQYPDGNRDAETLMIDPLTKDLYIISKAEDSVRVYDAPFPQSTTETITLEHGASLFLKRQGDFDQTVGGDISPSGLEILIKTYFTMHYWCRTPEQSLWQVFEEEPVTVPYISEPQGEAVGWAIDEMGYYTISEEPLGIAAHLYFYPRLSTTSVRNNDGAHLSFQLHQNYPNPFNLETQIEFQLSESGQVVLRVFDISGREVRTLVDEELPNGDHTIRWNGMDNLGNHVPSGIYLFRIMAGLFSKAIKMSLLK